MEDETARLETFVNWPRDTPVTPQELASSGFYYLGRGDLVKCVFCLGMLQNFEPGDSVRQEHRRHFPSCPFLSMTDHMEEPAVVNSSQFTAGIRPSGFNNVCQAMITTAHSRHEGIGSRGITQLDDNPIVTETPHHCRFATLQSRLDTYTDAWPSEIRFQTPQALAEAGFFYAGFNDSVKCFFCNGGLKSWEPEDDPWVEHARWYPLCGYVKQSKGVQFIKDIHAQKNAQTNFSVVSTPATLTRPAPDTGFKPDLTRPYARSVLDMGYNEDLVRRTIQHKWDTQGEEFPNAPALLDAIFVLDSTISQSSKMERGASKTVKGTESSSQNNFERGAHLLSEEFIALKEENRRLKEEKICKICMEADANILFLPCAHIVSCDLCVDSLRDCPICREKIVQAMKTYIV